jgi:hypothetical protein
MRACMAVPLCAVVAVVALAACSAGGRSEGLDPATLAPEIRGDYAIFERKCSKCHSLARPLQAGIADDEFWKEYVERMRRQPASGILPSDEEPILRFLHFYMVSQRRPIRGGAEEKR